MMKRIARGTGADCEGLAEQPLLSSEGMSCWGGVESVPESP